MELQPVLGRCQDGGKGIYQAGTAAEVRIMQNSFKQEESLVQSTSSDAKITYGKILDSGKFVT